MKFLLFLCTLFITINSQAMHRFMGRSYSARAFRVPRPQYRRDPRAPIMRPIPNNWSAPRVIKNGNTVLVRTEYNQHLAPQIRQVLENWLKP